MSNGALAQLTSYGAQDVYLSGNPQITFFKSVYKRHTNFAMQDVLVSTTSTFLSQTQDTKLTFKVARNGDLLGKCWFEVFQNTTGGAASTFTNWRNNTGHGLIKEITLRIGGQEIDKQDGYYLDIINELDPDGEEEHLGLNKHTSYAYVNNNHGNTNNCPPLRLFIPLKFWFNLNVGSALPLVALQYHEVEFDVVFRKLDELIVSNVVNQLLLQVMRR